VYRNHLIPLGKRELNAIHTTPEASDLQFLFKEMVEAGVTHIIEVSFTWLIVAGSWVVSLTWGFHNLTQDHLDYHGNLEDYYLAKQTLFTSCCRPVKKADRCGKSGRSLWPKAGFGNGSLPVMGYGLAPIGIHPRQLSDCEGHFATVSTLVAKWQLHPV
jgi:hypothetical protein